MEKLKRIILRKVLVLPVLLLSLVFMFSFFHNVATAHNILQETANPLTDQTMEWVEIPAPYHQRAAICACDFIAPDDGWAVGDEGVILHWNGENWTILEGPRPGYFTSLYDVQMLASDNVWAVGQMGYIAHWDGEKWNDASLSTDYDLNSLSLISRNLGFMSGWFSVDWTIKRGMFKWDGERWNQTEFPSPKEGKYLIQVKAIQMASPNSGWASGYDGLYRWNGETWQPYTSEKVSNFDGTNFSMLSSSDIWLLGEAMIDKNKGGSRIIHWDGSDWTEFYKTIYRPSSLHMLSPTQGWAVGALIEPGPAKDKLSNMIFYWDGQQWSEFYETSNYKFLTAICGFDQDHLWIFGYSTKKDEWGGPITIPVTLHLQQKPTATPTLAPTETPSPTFTPSPLPIIAATPTVVSSDIPTVVLASATPTPSESVPQKTLYLPIVVGSLLIIVLVVLLLLLRKK